MLRTAQARWKNCGARTRFAKIRQDTRSMSSRRPDAEGFTLGAPALKRPRIEPEQPLPKERSAEAPRT